MGLVHRRTSRKRRSMAFRKLHDIRAPGAGQKSFQCAWPQRSPPSACDRRKSEHICA
jgi:hypothetical protein